MPACKDGMSEVRPSRNSRPCVPLEIPVERRTSGDGVNRNRAAWSHGRGVIVLFRSYGCQSQCKTSIGAKNSKQIYNERHNNNKTSHQLDWHLFEAIIAPTQR